MYVSSVVVLTPDRKFRGLATIASSERYVDPKFCMLKVNDFEAKTFRILAMFLFYIIQTY